MSTFLYMSMCTDIVNASDVGKCAYQYSKRNVIHFGLVHIGYHRQGNALFSLFMNHLMHHICLCNNIKFTSLFMIVI